MNEQQSNDSNATFASSQRYAPMSDIIKQAAAKHGRDLYEITPNSLHFDDLKGLPKIF